MHRGSCTGMATRGRDVAYSKYGLMALERCLADTKQEEASAGRRGPPDETPRQNVDTGLPAEVLHQEAP